jgi:hypothetical protein
VNIKARVAELQSAAAKKAAVTPIQADELVSRRCKNESKSKHFKVPRMEAPFFDASISKRRLATEQRGYPQAALKSPKEWRHFRHG